jgi:ferritin-like metal-binding protein YciE
MATSKSTSSNGKTKSDNGKMPMENAMDLFVHELSDMRSAEEIIVSMLEEGIAAASNSELKKGLETHLEQTRGHVENLDKVFEALGVEPHDIECEGAKGLQKELQHALKAKPAPEVLDALIAGGAAKTEHYEISGYSGMVDLAKMLGEKDAQKLLQQNLDDEEKTLAKVEKIEEKLSEKLPMPAEQKS